MPSFLLLLFVSGGPPSPFPALLPVLGREYETRRDARRSDVRKEIQRAPSDAARAGKSSAAVRACVCINPLLSLPLLSRFPTRPLTRTELRGHCVV
ncbi:hypothetical protein QQF64_029498 [Cirrhinus molitorella]|uniref:Secreted protein n=1 Tax=Cirrhinus molitorella TaxID=172907 RepID=A0ABR3N0P1_9TELE